MTDRLFYVTIMERNGNSLLLFMPKSKKHEKANDHNGVTAEHQRFCRQSEIR